jgi:hypothetical protein
MSDTTPAIAGIQKCGCVTYVNSDPDNLDRADQKVIGRIVAEGGRIVRATVGGIKALPDFLPGECPHDPPGWTREAPEPPNRILYRRTFRGPARVSVRVPRWSQGFVASEGRYLPTLAGEPIRDGAGAAVRLPSMAEAAHYGELQLLASGLENVWIRTGPLDAAGDSRSWAHGVAGASLGPHPTLGASLRLAYIGIGVRGEARVDTTIRPRVVLRSVAA